MSDGDLAAIADAGRARLARVAPPEVIIGPAQVQGEGIVCDANPAESLAPVRDAARAAIADVWGPARVPGRSSWWPHVSLGYASAAGPAGPFEAALAGFTGVAAHTVSAIRLIRLGRDHHLWEWDVCATVPLGPCLSQPPRRPCRASSRSRCPPPAPVLTRPNAVLMLL